MALLVTDSMSAQSMAQRSFPVPVVPQIQTRVGSGMPILKMAPGADGKEYSILYWQAPKGIDPMMAHKMPNVDPNMPITLRNVSGLKGLCLPNHCLGGATVLKLDSTSNGW